MAAGGTAAGPADSFVEEEIVVAQGTVVVAGTVVVHSSGLAVVADTDLEDTVVVVPGDSIVVAGIGAVDRIVAHTLDRTVAGRNQLE